MSSARVNAYDGTHRSDPRCLCGHIQLQHDPAGLCRACNCILYRDTMAYCEACEQPIARHTVTQRAECLAELAWETGERDV